MGNPATVIFAGWVRQLDGMEERPSIKLVAAESPRPEICCRRVPVRWHGYETFQVPVRRHCLPKVPHYGLVRYLRRQTLRG